MLNKYETALAIICYLYISNFPIRLTKVGTTTHLSLVFYYFVNTVGSSMPLVGYYLAMMLSKFGIW